MPQPIPNYMITVTEPDPNENVMNGENENMIMQQNILSANENQKNKTNFKNILDTLKANKKSNYVDERRSSDSHSHNTMSKSYDSNKSIISLKRQSGSGKSVSNTINGANLNGNIINSAMNVMQGNIVPNMNFNGSPLNKDFYVPTPNINNQNMNVRMPTGFVTNSPMRMNDKYMYPNNFNNGRNVNPQMMGIMNMGMSPMDPNFNPHYTYNMMNQVNNQQINNNFQPEGDNQNFDRRKKFIGNLQQQQQFGNNKFYEKNMMNQQANNQPQYNFKQVNNNNFNNNKKMMMPNMNPQMNMMYRMKPVKSEKSVIPRTNIETQILNENVRLPNKMWRNHYNIQDNIIRKLEKTKEEVIDLPSPIEKDTSFENDDKTVLQIVIKLIDKEEVIKITRSEDTLKVSKDFCAKHQLNEELLKPIQYKIKQALKSIYLILDHNINTTEEQSLIEVQNIYNQLQSNDSFLNLSCITDLGDSDLHLDIDENIQLNMSK
jgi:hypothetical protein